MKKFLVLLLLVLLLCSCGKKKEEDSEYKVGTSNKIKDELAFKVKIEKINIREEPNTQSEILGVVDEGSKFIILDYTSDETFIWFHIKTKNKIEGYVASGRENPYVEILNGEVDIDPPVLRLLETNIKVKTHKEVTVDNFKDKYIEVSDNLGDVEVELKPDYNTSAGSHRYVIDIEATDKLKFLNTLLKASLILLFNILIAFMYFITSFHLIRYFNTIFNSNNSLFHSVNDIFIMCCHYNSCSSRIYIV